MTRFSLEEWLKDKSRKIVTRSGYNVRILCTDQRGNMPIVALVEFETLDGVQMFYSDGKNENHREYDLFFADDELTKFEKDLQIIISEASHWTSDDGSISTYCQFGDKEIKKISGQILDLARKELEKEDWRKPLRAYKNGYKQGKQDALKDLPKWKKATEHKEFEVHVCVMDEDMYPYLDTEVHKGEYYIELDDLKTLPKEE